MSSLTRGAQLKVIFGGWACFLGAGFAVQSLSSSAGKKTSMKLIHSRLYAQAATLSALGLAAASDMWTRSEKEAAAVAKRGT
jgi:hypothetical protein